VTEGWFTVTRRNAVVLAVVAMALAVAVAYGLLRGDKKPATPLAVLTVMAPSETTTVAAADEDAANAVVRAFAPAAAAYGKDHNTFVGMTIRVLQDVYDPAIDSNVVRIVWVNNRDYCVQTRTYPYVYGTVLGRGTGACPSPAQVGSATFRTEAGATRALKQAVGALQAAKRANGTYEAAALPIPSVVLVRGDASSYCIQTAGRVGGMHLAGPGGVAQEGPC
jgi:hypothetical protein